MAITLRGDGETTFNNNIGIGTTSPGEALHVHATGTTQIAAEFEANNAQSYIEFTGTDSTQILYGRDGADACIQTAGNDVFKALSNGNCSIVDGNLILADGHGINFGAVQGGGATSDLLDDYEEGTWTPTFASDSGGTGIWDSTMSGQYTKVGNVVVITANLRTDAAPTPSGSTLEIGGLPYQAANNASNAIMAYNFNFASSTHNWISSYVTSSNSNLRFVASGDNNTWDVLDNNRFGTNTIARFTLTYRTNG